MKLFFVTQSENKIAEATSFFAEISDAGGRSIDFCILKSEIQEIMHPKLDEVVRWKALEAFRSVQGLASWSTAGCSSRDYPSFQERWGS